MQQEPREPLFYSLRREKIGRVAWQSPITIQYTKFTAFFPMFPLDTPLMMVWASALVCMLPQGDTPTTSCCPRTKQSSHINKSLGLPRTTPTPSHGRIYTAGRSACLCAFLQCSLALIGCRLASVPLSHSILSFDWSVYKLLSSFTSDWPKKIHPFIGREIYYSFQKSTFHSALIFMR